MRSATRMQLLTSLALSIALVFSGLPLLLHKAHASDPLQDWVWRDSGLPDNRLNSIVFGNGMYVAVGTLGKIISSTDAITWTQRQFTYPHDLYSVAYGNGMFVAVGASGIVLRSSDGISWEASFTADSLTHFGVAFGNGLFVTVGAQGSISSSPDGMSWTDLYPGLPTNYKLRSVAFGNGRFVAVGARLSGILSYDLILTSEDGVLWGDNGGRLYSPSAVTFGNGYFAMCESGGGDLITNTSIKVSTDGYVWTDAYFATNDLINNIAIGGNRFVAAKFGSILTSTDATNWASLPLPEPGRFLAGISFDGHTFLIVGDNGMILQSGRVISPEIAITPSSHNFGSIETGKQGEVLVTISNNGNESLTLSNMNISGPDAGQFSTGSGTCGPLPSTLQPGASCTAGAYFSPTTIGSKSSSLIVSSNDPENPAFVISLSGTGTSDVSPPDTMITSGPPLYSQYLGAIGFTFTASEPGSTFQCATNSYTPYTWQACSSPYSRLYFTPLADGIYYFRVRATDPAGNTDPTPAVYRYVVDRVLPTGTVTVNNNSASTTSRNVTLTINADATEPDSYCAQIIPSVCGYVEMRISNDGVYWTGWERASTSRSWQLSSGNGGKVVLLQLRDGAGNVRQVSSQTIILLEPQNMKLSASGQADTFFGTISDALAALPSGKQSSLVTNQTVFNENVVYDRCEPLIVGPAYDDQFTAEIGMVRIKGAVTVSCGELAANGLEIM